MGKGKVLTDRLSMRIFAPLCVFLLRASNNKVIPFDICSGLEEGREGGREGKGGKEGGRKGQKEVMKLKD